MATDMEQINFRAPVGVLDSIARRAEEQGITKSELIRQALERNGIQMPAVPGRGRPARAEWAVGQQVILETPPHMRGEDLEAMIESVTPEQVVAGGAVFIRDPSGKWKTGRAGGFRVMRRVDG